MQLMSGGAVGSAQITDDSIVNADVNSAAGIVHSKMESDARARANHTGTQVKATVSDYPAAASQAEVEAGTEAAVRELSPLRVKQAITALGAAAPGLVFLVSDLVERTTVATSMVDLVTLSSLSLAAGTRVKVVGKARKSAGAAVISQVGLKINATIVVDPSGGAGDFIWKTDAVDQAEDGSFEFEFEVGETNYLNSFEGRYSNYISATGVPIAISLPHGGLDVPLPAATVTSIIITGRSQSASVTLAVNDVRVYTYRNS